MWFCPFALSDPYSSARYGTVRYDRTALKKVTSHYMIWSLLWLAPLATLQFVLATAINWHCYNCLHHTMVKASSSSSTSFTLTPLGTIVKLEAALLSTPFDPNPLLPLLALARHPSPEVVHKAIWVLHRVFSHFIEDGTTTSSGGDSGHRAESMEEEGNIGGWVRGRMTEYVTILGGLLRDSEATLRVRDIFSAR